jgi:hypothetical protein
MFSPTSNFWRWTGGGSSLTDSFQNRVRAQQPKARGVSDASCIERHGHNQSANRVGAPEVDVVGNELTPTVFAQVTLLPVGRFAILLDAQ